MRGGDHASSDRRANRDPQGIRFRLVTLVDLGYFQRQHISPVSDRHLSASAPAAAEPDALNKGCRRRKAEEREYFFRTAPPDADRHFGPILIKSDYVTWGSEVWARRTRPCERNSDTSLLWTGYEREVRS